MCEIDLNEVARCRKCGEDFIKDYDHGHATMVPQTQLYYEAGAMYTFFNCEKCGYQWNVVFDKAHVNDGLSSGEEIIKLKEENEELKRLVEHFREKAHEYFRG